MKSRPDLIRNNQCPTCGQYFHHLGIARHRAMHRDERDRARNTQTFENGDQNDDRP